MNDHDMVEKEDLPGVSIIIPTFQRAESLKDTLNSFIAIDYPKDLFEIIIIDNNSRDHTFEVVKLIQDQHSEISIHYVLEKRQGVHYARNSGAKQAHFDLLYYTDDDVLADYNLLREIIKPFLMDKRVGTATGRVLPKWEVEPPKWVRKHCYNSLLSLLDPSEEFIITSHINYLYSCHQMVRKNVLMAAGGFNPENTKGIWIGDGETGLTLKIEELGYKFGFNGKSILYHRIPPARMTQAYLNRRIGNSGYCYAYTNFWQLKPTRTTLLSRALLRIFLKAPLRLAYYLGLAIINMDWGYMRFIPAYMFFYFNRLKYDLNLLVSSELRTFVAHKNWFDDDCPIFPSNLPFPLK